MTFKRALPYQMWWLSMTRISILRLKPDVNGSAIPYRPSSINDKNLNSEIETGINREFRRNVMCAINDKNLNSEIETGLASCSKTTLQTTINDKNLNSEIETSSEC